MPREATAHRTALLESALHYPRQLGPVFPIHWPTPDGCSCRKSCGRNAAKHPLTEHGLLDASDDPETIRRWWAQWPDANVGLRTGLRCWALDVDPDKGGEQSLATLIARHGAIPETVEALTGGGGRHLLFALPASGVTIPPSAGTLGAGLESEGPVHDPLWVRLRAEELTETSVRARNLDAVLQALGTVPSTPAVEGSAGVLITSLVSAVKLSDKTIRGCLKDLEAAGKATIVGKASKGAALWAVTGQ
jgi:hypothetical protein